MTGDDTSVDVVVLRSKPHGIPSAACAEALRERRPDREIRTARTPRDERELVREARVAVGLDIDPDLVEASERLRLFACGAAGVGHLPMGVLEANGVAVTNASGIHAPNMAEQVIGYILAFARRLHEGWRRKRNREWRHFKATELNGSTVTIVGLGPIGRATAERLVPFDVETIGVRYTPEKGGPTDEVIGYNADDLHEAYARTDYLVIACPLTDTTRGLVDEEAFATLPPGAVLVNVARGPVVDTDALVGALRDNQVRGAALDVTDPEPLPPEHPLWTLGNVMITPHNAGHTDAYWERLADVLARNLDRIEETGSYDDLENQVSAP